MKLKELIKILHPDTVVAIEDGNSDIKVTKLSTLDNQLKEREVKTLYPARDYYAYDFCIELKS